MCSIALNSTEHILLKVPTCDGFELVDPRLKRGASYLKAWMSIGACITIVKNGEALAIKGAMGSCGFA